MADHLHALRPGTLIDGYEIVSFLGSGGFGITYLGRDVALDKPVAIKEYMPSDLAVRQQTLTVSPKSGQDKADFDWGLDRFLDEARTLARFDHPNVVKVSRFFRAHGTAYIVMEHVSGETLSEVLQRKGRLAEAELRGLMEGLLSGLEAVHAADYLHRDIKPGNVILRPDGTPVLLDFGSARQSVTAKSRSVTAIVTPGYAPIEQYSSRGNQGPWTDIYAVGAICYRAMTGEVPVDATERVRRDPLVPASEHAVSKGTYSPTLLAAVDEALKVDEDARPQSVAAWRALLSSKAAPTENLAPARQADPVPSPAQKDTPQKGRGGLVAAGIFAVVLGALGTGLLLSGQGTQPYAAPGPTAVTATEDASGSVTPETQTEYRRLEPAVVSELGHVKGDPDAPITLIEYASPTCPACKYFHDEVFPALEEKYVSTGKVKFVFREFPIHGQADVAAYVVALCAGEDSFFDVLDDLFENQEGIVQAANVGVLGDMLKNVAKRHGIETDEAFDACLENREYRDQLAAVYQSGEQFGVMGTPTFILDGKVRNFEGDFRTAEGFSKQIDALLAEKGVP